MSVIQILPASVAAISAKPKSFLVLHVPKAGQEALQEGDELSFAGFEKGIVHRLIRGDEQNAVYFIDTPNGGENALAAAIQGRIDKRWPLPFFRPNGKVIERSNAPSPQIA